ncbi:probable D-2-hydroxyglutarate dehydrogenase, mitochondrial isoform X1 [Oryza glaberrima]|uniref:Probable D-2-hydroxyglutarate dehydrogenase, mitochondrial n=2 Tax=Oryza glaberrima TaxID=4538 RepID=I1Q8M9_ORYGL|nr:probable D-2-hydroxyglutarate dehydrogenase, mitochondrial isoform X1 [Oryza glaberrima]XP_052161277.1 probable D-2-hydroxyglutarate dehydrogenase, mitochondrial isoform X1 [Oryza glaberrima]
MARRAAAGLLRRHLGPLAAGETLQARGMYPKQYGAANHAFSRFYSIQGQQRSLYGFRTNVETDDTQQSARMNFEVQKRSFSSAAAHVQRNPAYSVLNSDDVSYFKSILGESGVVQDEDRVAVANMDWMGKYKGSSQLLLLPKSTAEVSKILSYCNSRRLAVVPQGGNTGLVGGSVPVYDEVIISLGGMDKIITFDNVNGILTCEAGCVLENLSSYVENKGFIMPLDLGAKGSCHIGGNISTNAGGLRFIRYGSLHGSVLGLEVVLADGTVLDMLTTLRKDNTGYDLKHLFIGSEGSLGIVTKIAILTPAKLPSTNVAFLSCNDYISCQKLLLAARRSLGEILSAFEFMDRHCINLAMKYLEGVHNPLPVSPYNFYVLIETTGSDESYDKAKLEAFLLRSMEDGLVADGVIAQDISQASNFWRIREGISEASVKVGAVYKYDLSIPVEKLYDIVEEMRSRVGDMGQVLGYGHLGDGNLHLNILSTKYSDKMLAQIEPFVYEWTSKQRGSISAEHGLGLMKAEKIHYSKSSEAVQLMASIKKLLDPNSILNPYKVLPQSVL